MRIHKKSLAILLALIMTASLLVGCGTENTPTKTEAKETITVRAMIPFDWYSANLWAWKDGGEDAFEEFPGQAMEWEEDYFWIVGTAPGWVDRLVISNDDGTIQTEDISVEPGKDLWIAIFDDMKADIFYEDPLADVDSSDMEYVSPYADEPIYQAAVQEDYDTFKELLPTVTDTTILSDWDLHDFVCRYAGEAIMNGDYETAIKFYEYSPSDSGAQAAEILQLLVAGDLEGACDAKIAYGFGRLDMDLEIEWLDLVYMVTGMKNDPESLDTILMKEYLTRRTWTNQPSFTENSLVFYEPSNWEAEHYVSKLVGNDYYIVVDNINTLYKQCGTAPNGKILILRSQKEFSSGKTYYAVDLSTMEYLGYDLYPSSLAEVEHIIMAEYSYDNEGKYKQTFSSGSSSVVDYFTFLRVKGRVVLMDANGKTIESTKWLKGTGEVEAHFSDLNYQCSNMPQTGVHIIEFVNKIKEANSQNG